MPVTVHCVRHAQGFHNLGAEFHSLPDPRLTPLGEQQCSDLRDSQFADQTQFSLITASPLTRTLNTAFLTFRPALTSGGKCQPTILAIPDAQETSDYACDTGSDVPVITDFAKQQGWPVDLSLLKPDWNVKTMDGRYSPQSDAIKTRAKAVRQLLRVKARELVASGDEDVHIALVAHGGVLHYITADWEHADKYSGTGWANCETRAYTFVHDVDSEENDDADLVETMSSRRKRGLDYPMYGREKQRELFEDSMQGWEDQGLQRPDRLDVVEDDQMAAEGMGPLRRERTSSQGGERRPSVVKRAA